ncbi:MAG: nitroreductase family protein [Candidatus Altiarchaeota archaeon]|nr:nitroreductase family protein [Candidatus Altiarchaeota archaeon]
MDVTSKIKSRRSVRKYLKKKISLEIISDVLDCARFAPTARNVQPWFFVAVTDEEKLTCLGGLADHGGFIADCAACFAIFAKKDEKYYLEDGCAATMNIIHALNMHGIGSCWVAGDKKKYCEDVRELLDVGVEYTLVSLVSAGYGDGVYNTPKNQLKDVSKFM